MGRELFEQLGIPLSAGAVFYEIRAALRGFGRAALGVSACDHTWEIRMPKTLVSALCADNAADVQDRIERAMAVLRGTDGS